MTSKHDPADLEEQVKVTRGRKAPFARVADWVTVHPDVEAQGKALYLVLAAHVNMERGDGLVWPSRLAMAEMLGWSRPQTVDKYIKQLEAIGAIDTDDFIRPNGAKGKLYTVHETPPDNYDGITSVSEWHNRRRKALAAADMPKPGRPRKETPTAEAEPAKKTAAPPKKAAAKKTTATAKPEKSPEEQALDQRARKGADLWWERAKKLVTEKSMGPLMGTRRQKSGYYLNVVTRIREALAADYESKLILQALENVGEWSPAKRELDRELRRLSGVRAPRSGRSGRTPIFTNDQFKKDETTPGSPPPPAAPDLDVFGVESDDAA